MSVSPGKQMSGCIRCPPRAVECSITSSPMAACARIPSFGATHARATIGPMRTPRAVEIGASRTGGSNVVTLVVVVTDPSRLTVVVVVVTVFAASALEAPVLAPASSVRDP